MENPNSQQAKKDFTRDDVIEAIKYAEENDEPIDLRRWNLDGENLSGLNLFGAKLKKASFKKANLTFSDLRHANANGANFIDARLAGARIYQMDLTRASLPAYVFRQEVDGEYILGDWEHAKKTNNIEDYHHAKDVARELKNHLFASGRNLEAVWAFELEQRITRGLINPWRRLNWNRKRGKEFGIGRFIKFLFRWLVSWLADITTGYGEKVDRIFITFLVVQVAFALGYGLTDSIMDGNGVPVSDPFQIILFTLAAMTTTNTQDLFPANQYVELFMCIQVIVGIAVTGLLGFVLGNRIRYSS